MHGQIKLEESYNYSCYNNINRGRIILINLIKILIIERERKKNVRLKKKLQKKIIKNQ